MKPFTNDPARIVKRDPFIGQQGPLHLKPPLETAQEPVGANGPVTGHNQGKRIVGQGIAHGAGGIRFAEMPGDQLIGTDRSSRDALLCLENPPLKLGTPVEIDRIERKENRFPLEKSAYLSRNRVDFRAA